MIGSALPAESFATGSLVIIRGKHAVRSSRLLLASKAVPDEIPHWSPGNKKTTFQSAPEQQPGAER
jgi:hypothetical protein